MRWLLWATPVFVLAGCTLPSASWSVPPERSTVVDYDAEWKAFVRETLAVHEQKPEHPFWSAERLKEAQQ